MKAVLWLGVVAMSGGAIGCSASRGDLGTPMDDLATSSKQPHCTQYDVLMAAREALGAEESLAIGRVLYEPKASSSHQADGPHWKVEVLADQAGAKYVLVDDATGDVLP